jgi:hypothetical protein
MVMRDGHGRRWVRAFVQAMRPGDPARGPGGRASVDVEGLQGARGDLCPLTRWRAMVRRRAVIALR